MNLEKSLSIILPTYNRLYSIKEIFLPSLEKQTFLDYELIVVDDGSTDGTGDFFSGEDFFNFFPKIKERLNYIKNEKNLGAPESRNVGARKALGEWIFIVEDDIEIKDISFLEKFNELRKKSSLDIGVISPKREESISKGYYNLPENNFVIVGKLSGEIYLDPTKEYSGFVENTHCSSFIKKELYLSLGGQDSKTYFGNTFRDESDFYFRVIKNGYKIFYVGDVLKITHRNDFAVNGGQKKVNNKSLPSQEMMVWKNHYLYLSKNYNLAIFRILFFIFVRCVKHFSNLSGLKSLKNILAVLRI